MLPEFINKSPTPKRLVLSLLSARGMAKTSAAQCTQWGSLFEIEASAMRVTLGRMVKAGLLTSVARGQYSIGPAGRALSEAAQSWIRAEDRVGAWSGGWLLIHAVHVQRRDKKAARNRERALRLEGFKPSYRDLWCRPANYSERLSDTRDRLMALGLEREAVMVHSLELHMEGVDLTSLWPRRKLESGYLKMTELMQISEKRLAQMPVDQAARESFLVGEHAIRLINSDPMLPDAMIDGAARRKMHATMVHYDQLGQSAWQRFQAEILS
ncbi:MAG: PaaX [Pseudomonadota bacterium]